MVHVNHGIYQYLGVETMEVGVATRKTISRSDMGQDRLYLPTDQIILLLQRYVGLDDQPPHLSKLGEMNGLRVKKRSRSL